MLTPVLSAVLGTAWAQVDTSGPAPLPLAESATGPVRLAPAANAVGGGWSLALGLRGASSSLTTFEYDGETLVDEAQSIGGAFDVTLGGAYALHDRFTASLAVPVRVFAGGDDGGPGLGDPRVSVGIALLEPSEEDAPVVRLNPWVRVPVGSQTRQLSPGGLRAGASIAGGMQLGPVWGTAELGADLRPEGSLPGGPGWRWGLGGSVPLGDALAVGLESATWGLFAAKGRGVGNETLLTVSGRFGRGWGALATGPALIVREPGTAPFSGNLTVGIAGGPERTFEPDLPDEIVVRVQDAAGRPVRGARLLSGSREVGLTDADGSIVLRREAWTVDAVVRAPGLVESMLPATAPDTETTVEMPFAPVPIRVRVTDPLGEPIDVSTTLQRVDEPAEAELTQDGRFVLGEIGPGTWMLDVSAEGKGAQQRKIEVGERRERPVYIEVILLDKSGEGTLAVEVVDAGGLTVEGARIQVDGVPVGTTGSGGQVWVHDLDGESRSVTVRSEDYAEAVMDIPLNPESEESPQQVDVEYVPGTVRIRAEGPNGPVTDALLLISGPTALPPMPLGENGERLVVLDPGEWNISLSSVALGIQERRVEITPESPNPLLAEFILLPDLGGNVDLVVRVQDRDGAPLDSASIQIDGESVGDTASGGTLRLKGIPQGLHAIQVTHPAIETVTETFDATEGVAEHLVNVHWKSGVMRVTATAAGLPADAVVLFDGPADREPGALGDRGQRYFDGLKTGTWEVTASSAEYGIQTRRVAVLDPAEQLPEALIRYGGLEGGDNQLVVFTRGPDGEPLAGVPVSLDGLPMGATGSDGTVQLQDLVDGDRTVRACDAPYVETVRTERLRGGEGRIELDCAWAAGATRFQVTFQGEPASDALLLLAGPGTQPPLALDARGEQLLTLESGEWVATLSHPAAGLVEHTFSIPEAAALTEVAFDLDGDVAPSLLVRVRTPRGSPVADAVVKVAGTEVARSNAAGVAVVRDLVDGAEVTVDVSAAGHAPDAPRTVTIRGIRNEKVIELEPLPGVLSVSVTDSDGNPLDARIDLIGEERLPTLAAVGGRLKTEVPPGTWEVYARTPGWGATRKTLTIDGTGADLSFSLAPANVRRVGDDLQVPNIQFEVNRAEIDEQYGALLEELAAHILADPDIVRVEAQGHTDSRGKVAMNVELSQRRAEEVRYALIDLGVPQSRVVARGFGPTHPISSNEDDEGWAKNRRVAFVIVENVPAD